MHEGDIGRPFLLFLYPLEIHFVSDNFPFSVYTRFIFLKHLQNVKNKATMNPLLNKGTTLFKDF